MEILIVAMIMTVVVKRGVEDVWHTARGGTPPRLAAAKARRQSGAAGRYWGQLWDDVWTDAAKRHTERRDQRQSSPASSRPRGAATVFLSNLWRDGWVAAERRRSSKATRPRPGQETVPGTVVPNADERQAEPPVRSWIWRRVGWRCRICGSTQGVAEVSFGEGFKRFNTRLRYCPEHMADYGPGGAKIDYGPESPFVPGQDGDGDRPQDRPDPVPSSVPDEDGTVPQDGAGPEPVPDEDGPADKWQVVLPNGHVIITEDPENYRAAGYPVQPVRGYDRASGFDVTEYPSPATPTTEGPTTMTTTMPTDTEVTSLNKAIQYSESTAHVAREMVNSIDFTVASLASGGVTGIAVAEFTKAKEDFGSIASAFDRAAKEFKDQLAIQEAYNANPGAGTKEFIMGGR